MSNFRGSNLRQLLDLEESANPEDSFISPDNGQASISSPLPGQPPDEMRVSTTKTVLSPKAR